MNKECPERLNDEGEKNSNPSMHEAKSRETPRTGHQSKNDLSMSSTWMKRRKRRKEAAVSQQGHQSSCEAV